VNNVCTKTLWALGANSEEKLRADGQVPGIWEWATLRQDREVKRCKGPWQGEWDMSQVGGNRRWEWSRTYLPCLTRSQHWLLWGSSKGWSWPRGSKTALPSPWTVLFFPLLFFPDIWKDSRCSEAPRDPRGQGTPSRNHILLTPGLGWPRDERDWSWRSKWHWWLRVWKAIIIMF
jgi:hypothetical protein